MTKYFNHFVIYILAICFLSACSSGTKADLAITDARIITGTGEVLEDGNVLIKGNKILSIQTDRANLPDIRKIDAEGKTVLPGLIDAHIHLLVENQRAIPQSSKELRNYITKGLPDRLNSYLEAGITTVMSTGDFWPAIGKVQNSIRSGNLAGPRVITSGPVFTAPGGHPAVTICGSSSKSSGNPWCKKHMTVEVEQPQVARHTVDSLARQGVNFIKIVYDDFPRWANKLNTKVMKEIIDAAHDNSLQAYAHIMEGKEAITAIEAGLDGLVHIPFSYSDPEEQKNLIELIQSNNITTTTTAIATEYKKQLALKQGNKKLAQLWDKTLSARLQVLGQLAKTNDSLISLGTDIPDWPPSRDYHGQIRLLKEAGLNNRQIILAATRNAAIHLGRDEEIGTIENGKLADLIIVDGNPLKDLTALQNIEVVIKDGEIVVEN